MLGRDLVIISKKMFWLKLKICIKNIRTLTDEKYRGKSLQWSYLNDVLFIANSIAFLSVCRHVVTSSLLSLPYIEQKRQKSFRNQKRP